MPAGQRVLSQVFIILKIREEISPANWIKKTIFQGAPDLPDGNWFSPIGKSSYHRAFFLDVDGDGKGRFHYFKSLYGNLAKFRIWRLVVDVLCTRLPVSGSQYNWMEVFKKRIIVTFKPMPTGQDVAAFLTDIQDMPLVMAEDFCSILLMLILMVILIFSRHSFLFRIQDH